MFTGSSAALNKRRRNEDLSIKWKNGCRMKKEKIFIVSTKKLLEIRNCQKTNAALKFGMKKQLHALNTRS